MFLEDILRNTLAEVARRKQNLPLSELKQQVDDQLLPLDVGQALRGPGLHLIAEVKKASPSRGMICYDFAPVSLARFYAAGGAAAISVLTEEKYFNGNLGHLEAIKRDLGNTIPVIRKDFIIDPYQVYETRACGADAMLLIAACLEKDRLFELFTLSHELGMGCLVEVHNEMELESVLSMNASIIGINNRDLMTFGINLGVTRRLRQLVPPGKIVVSESGIKTREDIMMMRQLGINAVLVGEALAGAADISTKMKELMGED
jgi:indole-3-glycerol phosphate synthase